GRAPARGWMAKTRDLSRSAKPPGARHAWSRGPARRATAQALGGPPLEGSAASLRREDPSAQSAEASLDPQPDPPELDDGAGPPEREGKIEDPRRGGRSLERAAQIAAMALPDTCHLEPGCGGVGRGAAGRGRPQLLRPVHLTGA